MILEKVNLTEIPKIGDSILISAFPGTGKSYYVYNGNWSHYAPEKFACDSDSSKFDKSLFPDNYIAHIKKMVVDSYSRIFISSHKQVREALINHNLPFVLIYPSIELKDEYIARYKLRGNDDKFIELVSANWETWITELQQQTGCFHIVLKSNQFISNVI